MVDVNHAISLFNQNAFSQVCNRYEAYLGQNSTLDMVLAVSFSKLGNTHQAHQILTDLQQRFPTNPDFAFNDALVYKNEGNAEQCERCLVKAIEINGNYHPAHYALGNVNYDIGKFEVALDNYQTANQQAPNRLDYIRSLSACYGKLGQHKQAFSVISPVLGSGQDSPDDHIHAMQQLYFKNDYVAARKLYRKSLNSNQTSGYLRFYYGLIEIDQKKLVLAEQLLQQIDKVQLSDSDQLLLIANLAYCQFMLTGNNNALETIKSEALANELKELCVMAANLFETLGNLDNAETLLAHSENLFPKDEEIKLIRSKVLHRRKAYDQCEELLNSIQPEDPKLIVQKYYQQIKLFESTKRFEDCAKTIESIAMLMQSDVESEEDSSFVNTIERLASLNIPVNQTARQTTINQKMIFIVGFPRSGTTLLESKLAQIEGTKIFEETHALHDFLNSDANGTGQPALLGHLAALNNQQLDQLAADYLQGLQHYVSFDEDDVLIDKMPLNGMYIDQILTLFPNAQVIVMLRDPRDICVSCLKQSMIQTYSVGEFAHNYDVYMTFLYQRVNAAQSRVTILSYEDFVQEYKQTYAQLLNTLGISDATVDLSQTGTGENERSNRLFNTPSYDQVSKPVYTNAVASFTRYVEHINFSQPALLKWCKQLGYLD